MKLLQSLLESINEISSNSGSGNYILANKNKILIDKNNFKHLNFNKNTSLTFIDGGQAEILKASNLSLQFIRIVACTFHGREKKCLNKKIDKNEFYILITAGGENVDFKAQIFQVCGDKLIDENDLLVNSMDETIRQGKERASISTIGNMARRFAELSMAAKQKSELVVIDGNLDNTFLNEEKYTSRLEKNVGALAKSCNIFTSNGDSATTLLNRLGPKAMWSYYLSEDKGLKTFLVKLHEKSKFVFRLDTYNEQILGALVSQSNDPVFLGYPYGLILTDKIARVSNQEASLLKIQFIANLKPEIVDNLQDAHSILDNIG